MLLVVVVATVGSFWPHPSDHETVAFYLWSLVWLPWAIVALFLSESRQHLIGRAAGVVGDAVILLLSLALLPDAAGPLVIAFLLVAVASWMVLPTVPRWIAPSVIITSTAAVRLWGDPSTNDVVRTVSFDLVMLFVLVLWLQIDLVKRRAEVVTASLRSRAETVLARVPHPLVVTDGTGHLVGYNRATVDAFGVESEVGTGCAASLQLHLGERALDCTAGCALLALCGQDGEAVEVWRPSSTGGRQPLIASAAAIHDVSGKPAEIVHSLRDITRLKEADEAKTIFLATTSHELKTPLTVINGYAELLLRDDTNEELRHQGLMAIVTRGKELGAIVERLLLSSQIEFGRLQVSLRSTDVVAVVRERVEALAIVSGHHLVTLDVSPGVTAAVADGVALATAIDHLVDNAIKYSPEGSLVTVGVNGAERGAVAIKVRNQGGGMTVEQRKRCFDKFWQADGTDSRGHGGTGLGLYIVKSLVESMSGTITVDSVPGLYTEFAISLQAARESAQPAVPVPRRSVEAEPSMIREFMRQIGVPGGGGGA
jgi:signal transduction histidine kinase